MTKVVGVKIPSNKQMIYCKVGKYNPHKDDAVIVVVRGCEYFACVMTEIKDLTTQELPKHLSTIIRLAKVKDKIRFEQNLIAAKEAYKIAKEQITGYNLPMKLITSEYSLDKQKLTFSFTSEERVDFRELVRSLAKIFRTRIELRQIGSRDESKYLGGIGHCGRPLCCNSFLGDFVPVSIKMAKNQDLSLNPSKISGLCGRLMCCLKYEDDYYHGVKKELPDLHSYVETPDGFGIVTNLNLLKCQVAVKLDGYETSINYDSQEVKLVD